MNNTNTNESVNNTEVQATPSQPMSFDEMLASNKGYQAEFDRRVQKAIETRNTNRQPQVEQAINSQNNQEIADLKGQVEKLTESITNMQNEAKYKAYDKALTDNINDIIGDRKFVNEYTKNAVINDTKRLYMTDKTGKTLDDIFDEITKDKENIFLNPQQVKLPNINNNANPDGIDKEKFDKMSYKERVSLKKTNPDLFNQLNNQ